MFKAKRLRVPDSKKYDSFEWLGLWLLGCTRTLQCFSNLGYRGIHSYLIVFVLKTEKFLFFLLHLIHYLFSD